MKKIKTFILTALIVIVITMSPIQRATTGLMIILLILGDAAGYYITGLLMRKHE